ncbi:hypothetical protein NONI108955_08810 [Nocardia ninae]|uniref:Uncharacterized protein n=1 Tax=Nocardia ninae NBRC 108245 TaxID=1210091 RepID=A0A511MLN8_9NOCA|nr:hypothetical protein NN4_53550 [Nocardia ninae NBRC 108245]
MDWATVALGVGMPVTVAAVTRCCMFFYALHGTDPKDRPAIIRALGRMHQDARSELRPIRRRDTDKPELPSGS